MILVATIRALSKGTVRSYCNCSQVGSAYKVDTYATNNLKSQSMEEHSLATKA